jgi:hypothetical protein
MRGCEGNGNGNGHNHNDDDDVANSNDVVWEDDVDDDSGNDDEF